MKASEYYFNSKNSNLSHAIINLGELIYINTILCALSGLISRYKCCNEFTFFFEKAL